MESDGILMPVKNMEVSYKKAGRYDELLTIEVIIPEKPSIRCRFHYNTFNESGVLLNTAEMELFFVKKANLRPCPLPEHYSSKLDAAFPV